MSNEVHGVEALKECFLTLAEIGLKIKEAKEDGKITWTEKISVGASLLPLIKSISKGKQIKEEFLDLSDEERSEIVHDLQLKLELGESVEKWLDWSLKVIDTIAECPAFD